MKKYISILLAVVALLAAGCREELKELNKGEAELALTANGDTIVLNQNEYSSDGLILQWTSGSNRGTGHRIYYSLELMPAGRSWDEALMVFNGVSERFEQKWTVDEINSLIVRDFGLGFDGPVALSARIKASGDGFDEQVAECTFVMVPYEPITHTLFIVGNATPGGWTLSEATELEMRDIGQFKTTVMLKQGFFKFICSRDGMLPGYMPGASDDELALRESASQQDKMWTVTEPHLYEIVVNLVTMKLSMTQVSAVRPEYDDLYLIGNETGWNFWPMQRDALDPFLFRIGHYWTLGKDFKFGTASGAWENNYKATSADAPYTQETMAFVKGYEPDNKWWLKDDELNKMYKICVDIHTAQERMIMREYTPYTEMYMIGDATSAGWELANAVEMTQVDDSLFTWTGNLSAGALKFSCDRQSDWNGAWFMASLADKEPSGEAEPVLFIDKRSESLTRYQYAQSADVVVDDIDLKWHISEAGKYTITLDQLHERVTFIRE